MLRDWLNGIRKYGLWSCAAFLASAGLAHAGDDIELKVLVDQQGQMLKQQSLELQELKRQLASKTVPVADDQARPYQSDQAVKDIVHSVLQEEETKKKAAEQQAKAKAEAEGYKVGTDLGIKTHWDFHNGVWFETPNKDFTSHIGFRAEEDTVGWKQTIPVSQVGDFQDGTFFAASARTGKGRSGKYSSSRVNWPWNRSNKAFQRLMKYGWT